MSRAWMLVALSLAAPAVLAATNCRIVSGGGVAFGPYDTLGPSPIDTALTLQVSCTRSGGPQNVVVTMSLGTGIHGSSASARRMLNSAGTGDYLSYGLFRDNSRSSAWGYSPGVDTVTQSVAIANNSTATLDFTIFGRIPALQDVAAGSYSDSVSVTVSP